MSRVGCSPISRRRWRTARIVCRGSRWWVIHRDLHGPVASTTTTWRLLDERITAGHLPGIARARAAAREIAWAAGAAPPVGQALVLDATICLDYSDAKENAAATWKHTYGFHPLLVFLDRPDIAGGEALAGLLRAGNAGSNTTADHITVLDEALAALPTEYRPQPVADPVPVGPAAGRQVLIRSDSDGATYGFAAHARQLGVGFSFGFPVRTDVKKAVQQLDEAAVIAAVQDGVQVWAPTIDADNGIRDGAWVAEATHLVDLSGWPAGSRVIIRKERPHPGAQLTFTDLDGHRITAFITDTPVGVVAGQLAGLDLRHRQHARVEDRIREAKATGLRNFPCHAFTANQAWLAVVMTATDLIAWTKLIGFTTTPELARCEITTFRYRVLHVAARLARTGRQTRLRLDATWRWTAQITVAWHQIRAAFT